MKLGIMQPYIFPYIGYFQLIHAVDRFIAYDRVNFIKKGWINRNKILLNGKEFFFTVPLENAGSFRTIAETGINQALYPGWRVKFFKTLKLTYANAPNFHDAYDLVTAVFDGQHNTISGLASKSLQETIRYLGIDTEFIQTSNAGGNRYASVENEMRENSMLEAKDRVIAICKIENADTYINPVGGKELYLPDDFAKRGIKLNFIRSHKIAYPQFKNDFVPWLSVIDVMMFNKPGKIKTLLNEYDLD